MVISNKPRRSLSFWLTAIALLSVFLLFVSRAAIYETDHQLANIAGVLWGLVALLLGFLAMWASKSLGLKIKLIVTAVPAILAGLFFYCFEYAGVTGEVLPSYRLRSFLRSKPPVRPQRPDVTAPEIAESHKHRFLQYLGNDRVGIVNEPIFATNWDRKLPTEVWRRPIGAGWSGFAVAEGIAVTLEQLDEEESLTAMSLADGHTLWQVKRPGKHFHALGGLGPRSTPTILQHQDTWLVVALSATGHLVCVDLKTGMVRWEHRLLELSETNQTDFEKGVNWGRAASPLVHDQRVIVPLGGDAKKIKGSLMACSLDDGSVLWTQGTSQVSYASPMLMTIHGVKQIVSVNEGDVTGHAWEDGRVLWKSDWPSNSNGAACASQPVQIDGNRILVGKGYTQGSKLFEVSIDGSDDPKWSTKDIWAINKILKTKFTSSIPYDGKLYGLSDGILECVKPDDGSRIWRGQRYGQGQSLMVNGTLIISSEDGRLVAVDRETGKPIAEMSVLEGVTWNTFAVAGPYLLVRNGTEAVCLSSPTLGETSEQ
ncbi:MAG: PQQ-binding-like beta-propeller repeat protein [Pirellula sp.]